MDIVIVLNYWISMLSLNKKSMPVFTDHKALAETYVTNRPIDVFPRPSMFLNLIGLPYI
jgi:hypothetical protein